MYEANWWVKKKIFLSLDQDILKMWWTVYVLGYKPGSSHFDTAPASVVTQQEVARHKHCRQADQLLMKKIVLIKIRSR